MENLLWHISGVYDYTHGKNFDDMLKKNVKKIWTLQELTDMAYAHPDFSKSGEKYKYSNTDYILLGMIIEKITQKPLIQVFDEYFRQYHLKNTYYLPIGYPEKIKNRMAHGYNQDGTFQFNQDVTTLNLSFSQSAGAVISNPTDVVSWLEQLFSEKIITGTSLTALTKVLSEENAQPINFRTLQAPDSLSKDSFTEIGVGAGIGLVYFKNSGFAWVHAGGMPGYESFYLYDPCDGIYVVLMYNVKPKQSFIFAKITEETLAQLHHSELVGAEIKSYRQTHSLPAFCHAI